MKTFGALGAIALLTLAGCNQQHSVSGTYLTRYTNGAAQLQLIESQSGQVMGSFTIITVKADGQAEREDVSITGGTVDANGQSLVLAVKPNALLSQAQNIGAQVTEQGIDMQAPWGNFHFVAAKPGEFDAAVNESVAAGKQQHTLREKAEQMANDEQRIAALTQSLAVYNTHIQGNTQGPELVREQEEQLVAAALKELHVVHDLEAKHQDFAADQRRFRVGQLAFQMGQLKFQLDGVLQQGHDHLAEFDKALAESPCYTRASLQGCDALGQEKMRYTTTRAKVENNLAKLSGDLQKNQSAIDAINKQAGN